MALRFRASNGMAQSIPILSLCAATFRSLKVTSDGVARSSKSGQRCCRGHNLGTENYTANRIEKFFPR